MGVEAGCCAPGRCMDLRHFEASLSYLEQRDPSELRQSHTTRCVDDSRWVNRGLVLVDAQEVPRALPVAELERGGGLENRFQLGASAKSTSGCYPRAFLDT